MKTNFKKYLFTSLLVIGLSFSANAQITFPDDVDDEAPAAPIDGLIVVGLAAGAVLGLRNKPKE